MTAADPPLQRRTNRQHSSAAPRHGDALPTFAAAVPPDLAQVDELLTAYGRWATQHARGANRCGSAERLYRRPAGDDDPRRNPLPAAFSLADAMRVQRALALVPELERRALVVLYIPNRLPVVAQLRMLRMTPEQCQQRHAAGLRMLALLLRREAPSAR